MAYPLENEGVLTVVMERFQKQRLPRIMHIKDLVDNGGTLNQSDINFLSKVLSDTRQYVDFVSKHQEYQNLFAQVTSLYDTITRKALNNETKITKVSTLN
ncbi:MAG: hypothetical protein KZQ64_02515 [gamma proteobacterium symbiont of Bathyaustriella thionipta]|nr:hypothetical protein [gamma proteobacterium symbiont of Bathyaustriella thionipta]MCU7951429.1 hypothetical protein [gamma proteobacterium symbiont of Bathyaustriella thionipta]MCU7952262.1 hypothetical protein [gamma proteobacterium symbiont of Bathyaustriella thionipta]MCU7957982.1 hypothetical protein [gamma proteobacterium symbiont of Bathyaustriella thionipta]MCU7966128.1 hypothetical protein [gamma proteobacterium symbiont of Bathyaustriella thionipta]